MAEGGGASPSPAAISEQVQGLAGFWVPLRLHNLSAARV